MIQFVEDIGDSRRFCLTAWTKAGMAQIDGAINNGSLPEPHRQQDYLEKRTVTGRGYYFYRANGALERARNWLDQAVGPGNYSVKSFAELAK